MSEFANLKVNGNETAERPMVEKKIDILAYDSLPIWRRFWRATKC